MPISNDSASLSALDELNEIVERHHDGDRLMAFIKELTEYFGAVEIVLILRAAEHSVII